MTSALVLAAEAGSANTAEAVLFWVFAVIGLGAGIAMVSMRNVVHAALMLVINLLSIAALYLGLQSDFLSIIQIIVYAGAIVVLFLFVIMLLGVHRDDLLIDVSMTARIGAVLGTAGLAAILLFGIVGVYTTSQSRCGEQAPEGVVSTADTQACAGMEAALDEAEQGSVGVVAERLFTRYTFPFEAAAVLLTVATIGAMLLGRRHDVPQDEDPSWVPSAEPPHPSSDLGPEEQLVESRIERVGEDALHPDDRDALIHERTLPGGGIGTEYGAAAIPEDPTAAPTEDDGKDG